MGNDYDLDFGDQGAYHTGDPNNPYATDQLIASAAKDAQELRWILNSGIPLTEKQSNDLIDRINGIKKSEGGLDPLGNIASNIPRGDSVPIDPKTGQPYPYGPTQFPGGNPQAKIAAKQTDGSVLTPTDAALVAGGNYAPYYTDYQAQTAQNVLQNAPDDWDPVEEYGTGSKAVSYTHLTLPTKA